MATVNLGQKLRTNWQLPQQKQMVPDSFCPWKAKYQGWNLERKQLKYPSHHEIYMQIQNSFY